jgi:glycosyltransferase involved in cell wall biosynthesis
MKRIKIHVLYEHGADLKPYGSAYVRLLRPLTHPVFRPYWDVTTDREYTGQAADAVIVDRLWRPDVSLELVEHLYRQLQRNQVRLLYAIDDNFLELAKENKDWHPTEAQLQVVQFLLQHADGVLVTTLPLKEQFAAYNTNIVVVPNLLDDRLLAKRGVSAESSPLSLFDKVRCYWNAMCRQLSSYGRSKKVIGYMGTFTHDDDLLMVLPALRELVHRYGEAIEIQLLGVAAHRETKQHFEGLPVRIINLRPASMEYPRFMSWFTRHMNWDVAIAPLCDNVFNLCKSDIKFLDYSAVEVPGVYSYVPAYTPSVRHLDNGWLAENTTEAWLEAFEALLFNEELKKSLRHNAARYLYTERTVSKGAHYWLTALDQCLGI